MSMMMTYEHRGTKYLVPVYTFYAAFLNQAPGCPAIVTEAWFVTEGSHNFGTYMGPVGGGGVRGGFNFGAFPPKFWDIFTLLQVNHQILEQVPWWTAPFWCILNEKRGLCTWQGVSAMLAWGGLRG
eukprot:1137394-Pelagomonas_calceolata.AAC.4